MLITPRKTPIDILDTNSEHFLTPKRPLRDRSFSKSPVASSSKNSRSPREKGSISPEKGVSFSTGIFYKPKTEYLNVYDRIVVGKPKIYFTPPIAKAKSKSAKAKKISNSAGRTKNVMSKAPLKRPTNSVVTQKTADTPSCDILEARRATARIESPVKSQNPSKTNSPRTTPTKRKSPSPRKPSTPPRGSPRNRRKFFVSRSPTLGRKRWMGGSNGKINFILDFNQTKNTKRSPTIAKKPTPLKNWCKKIEPTNEQRKIENGGFDENTTNSGVNAQTNDNVNEQINDDIFDISCQATEENDKNKQQDEITNGENSNVQESESNSENVANGSPIMTSKKCYPIFNTPNGSNKGSSPNLQRFPARSSPRRFKSNKFSKSANGPDQMVIDAGQRELGAEQCPSCSMVYSRGDPHDELMHSKFHEAFHGTLRFSGWKKERTVGKFMDGRVIMILPSDPVFMLRKVHEVRQIIDRELGYSNFQTSRNQNAAFLLYVTEDKKIVGCVIAESISKAYRVLSSSDVPCSPSKRIRGSPTKNFRGWYCSTEPEKALCGINRIWTDPVYRRCKVASRLVDSLRGHFIYGQVLAMDDIAFSDPTEQGRSFATKYTGTETFLVYK